MLLGNFFDPGHIRELIRGIEHTRELVGHQLELDERIDLERLLFHLRGIVERLERDGAVDRPFFLELVEWAARGRHLIKRLDELRRQRGGD